MENQKKSHVLNMTEGSPARLLLKFSLPLFCGNLLQQLYNIVDTSIAGNLLGEQAVAQIGATVALYGLIVNFVFGLNNGLALAVSQSFGAKDTSAMKRSVCWMTLLAGGVAVLLTGGLLLLRKPMMALLQTPEELLDGALAYVSIILAGIPLTMAYNLESALLQALGNSRTPLLFLLFSSFVNVGLDFLFMGPFAWGVGGAAAATVLSQGISAGLGLWYIMRHYRELSFGAKELKAQPAFVRGMLWTGLSMGLMTAIYNIGSVILQGSINALGSMYIAAQVGARRIAEMVYVPILALGSAVSTYASQNYGAGKRGRILRGIKVAMALYAAWWAVALVFTFTAAPAVIRLITGSSNPEVINSAALYLHMGIPMTPPMALLIILRNALQGMRKTLPPLTASTLEMLGKIGFAIWLVPRFGYTAVCACEPFTWVICCLFITLAAVKNKNEFQDNEKQINGNEVLA